HAFTIIEIKLLKDSIQHTTSSCTLAKFALAQLIDNIDFRILTYLEQQQQLKQHYPDIRVRQAIASTFAKFVDHNSFLLCQWIYKIHHSLQAQASTRIQIVCHNEKDSSTTSNTDEDKKVNRTRLGTLGNNPSMMKLFELIRSSYQIHKSLLNSSEMIIIHFIYCIAEFLVMLSYDTLHSKQVIKIQDLIKHYDSLLASRHEPETHVASHLFFREGIHLDESGLLLVLLVEQFLPLPYTSVLRLAELIVYDCIEMMLTLDQQTLNK
ncbi:unnamed protein product, partial [Rotaria sp. Silwood1]